MTITQKAQILNHLKQGKSITPLEALKLYGSFRLGDVIFKLKKQGFKFNTELVPYKKSRFAKYSLIESL